MKAGDSKLMCYLKCHSGVLLGYNLLSQFYSSWRVVDTYQGSVPSLILSNKH